MSLSLLLLLLLLLWGQNLPRTKPVLSCSNSLMKPNLYNSLSRSNFLPNLNSKVMHPRTIRDNIKLQATFLLMHCIHLRLDKSLFRFIRATTHNLSFLCVVPNSSVNCSNDYSKNVAYLCKSISKVWAPILFGLLPLGQLPATKSILTWFRVLKLIHPATGAQGADQW